MVKYRDYELMLRPGDKIFKYTDGVPEVNNTDGELYTLNQLESAPNRFANEASENIPAGMFSALLKLQNSLMILRCFVWNIKGQTDHGRTFSDFIVIFLSFCRRLLCFRLNQF